MYAIRSYYEKEGSVTNSGRWLLWHHKAIDPEGQSRTFGDMLVPLLNKVRDLYAKGGTLPEAVLSLDWPKAYDCDEMAKKINGLFTADTKIGEKTYAKGQLVPSFAALKDDGSTTSLNWLYCGSYTEEGGNLAKRRDVRQTPMQENIGLYPNWAWCWPVNRRILYNRASVDLNGKP